MSTQFASNQAQNMRKKTAIFGKRGGQVAKRNNDAFEDIPFENIPNRIISSQTRYYQDVKDVKSTKTKSTKSTKKEASANRNDTVVHDNRASERSMRQSILVLLVCAVVGIAATIKIVLTPVVLGVVGFGLFIMFVVRGIGSGVRGGGEGVRNGVGGVGGGDNINVHIHNEVYVKGKKMYGISPVFLFFVFSHPILFLLSVCAFLLVRHFIKERQAAWIVKDFYNKRVEDIFILPRAAEEAVRGKLIELDKNEMLNLIIFEDKKSMVRRYNYERHMLEVSGNNFYNDTQSVNDVEKPQVFLLFDKTGENRFESCENFALRAISEIETRTLEKHKVLATKKHTLDKNMNFDEYYTAAYLKQSM